MSWTIRLATEADLRAILELEHSIPDLPHWPQASYAGILPGAHAASALKQELLLVAAPSGRETIDGFAVASLGPAPEAVAELETLAVRPDVRRRGLARLLCAEIIEWSRAHGARTLMLEVRARSHGALQLYSSIGFAEVGRRPRYYADPPDDAVLMSMLLLP